MTSIAPSRKVSCSVSPSNGIIFLIIMSITPVKSSIAKTAKQRAAKCLTAVYGKTAQCKICWYCDFKSCHE